MISEFVNEFMIKKLELRKIFKQKHPDDYKEIVKNVISIISNNDSYDCPDPNRIHVIDDGDYQGTLVFVIAAKGYQPFDYWYVQVNYGSCSGCDTLQGIRDYGDELPTEKQVDEYMTLALHIIQGLKKMNDN